MTYSYDRTAGKLYVDPYGNPTGPNTPWGKADSVTEIIRGVRWVATPGHGGLGVARGVALHILLVPVISTLVVTETTGC